MNPLYALLNACNVLDLVYGAAYAIGLLAKGVGPYGNGSWNRGKGGYSKMRDPITEIQMKRARTIREKMDGSSTTVEEDAFKFEPIRARDEMPDEVGASLIQPSTYNSRNVPYEQYDDPAYRGGGRFDEEDDQAQLLKASHMGRPHS